MIVRFPHSVLRRFGHYATIATLLIGLIGLITALPAHADDNSGKGSSGSGSGSGKGGGGKGTDDSTVPGSVSAPGSTPTTQPVTIPPGGAAPPSTNAPVSASPPVRIKRDVKCGKSKMELDIRSDGRTVELKSRIQPDDKRTWIVSIVRDRTIVWKGKVERGRLERTFADLPGSEMINVRFSNSSGTVCSASATLPG